ncbi:MAG: TonB-dependent receptor [Bacteroidales bacterium]|nr:TonB-dependent receptor [Bacteroidales bacterium]
MTTTVTHRLATTVTHRFVTTVTPGLTGGLTHHSTATVTHRLVATVTPGLTGGLAILIALFTLFIPLNASAQNDWWNDDPSYVTPIEESAVIADRSLSEIGQQKSRLDSAALKLTVSQSMADILTYNSSIFVKQYGRGSLATVSFRGTAASHTQVTWNGMKINSPMLGMTDFSLIPSYFTDRATLLHGSSSLAATGGGLGGAVLLETAPDALQGVNIDAVLGAGSFSTWDGFLKVNYGGRRLKTSTRVAATLSRNDFTYRNYNKKEYTYDAAGIPNGSYYPIETNRCGSIRDLHLMQDIYYTTDGGDRLSINAWWMNSVRGVPLLSVDYRNGLGYINQQSENTLRLVTGWNHSTERLILSAKAGWLHTRQGYDFARDKGNGVMAAMITSRSLINTIHGQAEGKWLAAEHLLLTAQLSLYQHFVKSTDRNALSLGTGTGTSAAPGKTAIGYDEGRFETSAYISAKWNATSRLGISAAVREELYGESLSPIIPVINIDYLITNNLTAKASASRNFRYPTLNDLYFLPGGNPDLLPESGYGYDAGLNYDSARDGRYAINASATWFDSYIDNWIVWIPTFKGYWTPRNVKQVHAYGIETRAEGKLQMGRDWQLSGNGCFAWTPSINHGDPADWADEAIGKQLVYIPQFSASSRVALAYRNWRLSYKWCWYSERYTTSDNDIATRIGRVLPYIMNDIVLEKRFALRDAGLSLKLAVNNLFNEEYESVLNHPMPGRNFEFFIEITPHFNK